MNHITLSDIIIYPIKSAAGISLPAAQVTKRGLAFDRHWMLVDESGRFLTQREEPRIALIQPELYTDHLVVKAPGQSRLELPLNAPFETKCQVRIWNDTCTAAVVSSEVNDWFSTFLGVVCRLVFMPPETERQVDLSYAQMGDQVGFADGFSFLLISEASLDYLNACLNIPLPMNRFRPNLVVKYCDAYAEDDWKDIRIGSIDFRVVKPCARCSITTVDQSSGLLGKEPLKTLAGYRKFGNSVMFGQNLVHGNEGILKVGDIVQVI